MFLFPCTPPNWFLWGRVICPSVFVTGGGGWFFFQRSKISSGICMLSKYELLTPSECGDMSLWSCFINRMILKKSIFDFRFFSPPPPSNPTPPPRGGVFFPPKIENIIRDMYAVQIWAPKSIWVRRYVTLKLFRKKVAKIFHKSQITSHFSSQPRGSIHL